MIMSIVLLPPFSSLGRVGGAAKAQIEPFRPLFSLVLCALVEPITTRMN